MAKKDEAGKPPALRLHRHYDATPEEVWRAWTQPEEMRRWWGPGNNDLVHLAEADVRVGGRFRVAVTSDSDEALEVSGVYSEVVPNRKLVFTWAAKSAPEQESKVAVTFEPSGGGTDLTLLHEQFPDSGVRDAHEEGWSNALAKIDAVLAAP